MVVSAALLPTLHSPSRSAPLFSKPAIHQESFGGKAARAPQPRSPFPIDCIVEISIHRLIRADTDEIPPLLWCISKIESISQTLDAK